MNLFQNLLIFDFKKKLNQIEKCVIFIDFHSEWIKLIAFYLNIFFIGYFFKCCLASF